MSDTSSTMHKSLTPRTNIILAVAWASVLAVALTLGRQSAVVLACIVFPIGVVAGLLQARAIGASAPQMQAASSAMEVRRALLSTKPGKYATVLLWVVGIGAIAWVVVSGAHNPFTVWLAGYCSFALARDLSALPAVFRLQPPHEPA